MKTNKLIVVTKFLSLIVGILVSPAVYALPDLIVSIVDPDPGPYYPGTNLSVDYRIENIGPDDMVCISPNVFRNKLYFSTDSTWDPGDTQITGNSRNCPFRIDSGDYVDFTAFGYRIPSGTVPGYYCIIAYADDGSIPEIEEESEINNTEYVEILVEPRPPTNTPAPSNTPTPPFTPHNTPTPTATVVTSTPTVTPTNPPTPLPPDDQVINKWPESIRNDGTQEMLIRTRPYNAPMSGVVESVTLDLTAIGLGLDVMMYDDGQQGGDSVRNDGVYSYSFRIDDPNIVGTESCSVSITFASMGTYVEDFDVMIEEAPSLPPSPDVMVVGLLTIKTDNSFTEEEPNFWVTAGHVCLNDFLYVDGVVYLDQRGGSLKVLGNGLIYVPVAGFGTVDIYDGNFDINAADGVTTGLNSLASNLELSGLEAEVTSLLLTPTLDGVIVAGTVKLPEVLGNASADIQSLTLSASEMSLVGSFNFPGPYGVPGVGWQVQDVNIYAETQQNNYALEGTLVVPNVMELTATATALNGYLESVGVDILTSYWIPNTSFGLTFVHGGISGLYQPPMILDISAILDAPFFPSGPPPLFIKEVEGGVLVDTSGYIHGNVLSRVFTTSGNEDGFELGTLDIEYGQRNHPQPGLHVWGTIHLEDPITASNVVEGSGDVVVSHNGDMTGEATGTVQVPEGYPFIGGLDFTDISVNFTNTHVSGEVSVGILIVSIAFTDDGNFEVGLDLTDLEKTRVTSPRDLLQTFDLPAGIEQVIFRSTWSENDTAIELVKPDSSRITEADADDISITYRKILNQKEAYYVVNNPEPGFWGVDLLNLSNIGIYNVECKEANETPRISILEPSTKQGVKDTQLITWIDSDDDDSATINLFYSRENSGCKGNLIVADLSEDDPSNQYLWDTSGLASGDYYVYAVIDDQKNAPCVSYSIGTVSVVNPNEPATPGSFTAISCNEQIHLQWDTVADADGYQLKYWDDSMEIPLIVGTGSSTSHTVTELVNGTTYYFTIAAFKTDGYRSYDSSVVTAVPNPSSNLAPIFNSSPNNEAVERYAYNYPISVTDPEGHPFVLGVAAGPIGMIINDGNLTWTPLHGDIGDYRVTLVARDCRGLITTQEFLLTVLRDIDRDGIPDMNDPDRDNDGIPNPSDSYPDDTDNDGIPNEIDTDDDNDGMPDIWEELCGLDSCDPADADDDPDNDGYDNLTEYRSGTDPWDSNSSYTPTPTPTPTNTPTATNTPTNTPTVPSGYSNVIYARTPTWQDTGLSFGAGEPIEINAVGIWCGAPWSCCDANGEDPAPPGFLVEGLPAAGLIGKCGDNAPFIVGTHCEFNWGDHGTGGSLQMAFNDYVAAYDDNSGEQYIYLGPIPTSLPTSTPTNTPTSTQPTSTPFCDHDWVQVFPDTSPEPRHEIEIVFDSNQNISLLFGGGYAGGSQSYNDTWDFNGNSSSWELKVPSDSPSERIAYGMDFDSARNVVVLFGGSRNGYGTYYNDTWEYNGLNWQEMTPATSPSPRRHHKLAYDICRGVSVIFGGYNGDQINNETWEWNGSTWTQIFTANAPSPRGEPLMAFDSYRCVVVMFGGVSQNGTENDIWEYNGQDWEEKHPSLPIPDERSDGRMVFDSSRNLCVIFAGSNSNEFLNDTWTWNGIEWTQEFPQHVPPARTDFGLVYDQELNKIIAFGGHDGQNFSDTWEYRQVDTPTPTSTPTPSITPTNTPSNTPTPTPTNTPSNTPTFTPSPTVAITPTPRPIPAATPGGIGLLLFLISLAIWLIPKKR